MALIIFIENRGKTSFWNPIALDLQRRGHEISWIVQNPQYIPDAFKGDIHMHVLPFPLNQSKAQPTQDEAWVKQHYPALITDRGRTYFGAGTTHYAHYTAEIERVLQLEKPDLVVGESTLFHELIAIDLCRTAGILYVHPCANRYPSERFSIFSFDTQNPAAGSGDIWLDAKARDQVERIATGREVPFYMRSPSRFEKLGRTLHLAAARATVWRGRLRGERYNTPSLHSKLSLRRQLKKNLQSWQALESLPSDPARTLLYPLQMQPEANIDVWGRPHSDQTQLIRAMLAAAPADVQVAIKANPKSKYEVSIELLALATQEPRVCLIPLTMSMAQAQACTVGTLTVSGTVGFEAALGKGRCLSLRHPLIERNFPSLHASSVADGVQRLLNDPQAGLGGTEVGMQLIQQLVKDSFAGLVSEPLYHPACIDPKNVILVADALHALMPASISTK